MMDIKKFNHLLFLSARFTAEPSVIFMCSQSLFKLKPDFDLVLRDILLAFDYGSDNHTQVYVWPALRQACLPEGGSAIRASKVNPKHSQVDGPQRTHKR